MELYPILVKKRCFSRSFIVSLLQSEQKARSILEKYLKMGSIERVRRDFYTVLNPETGETLSDKFQIASSITDDTYVSHTSVFEYYDILPKHDLIYVATQKRLTNFYYQGVDYRFMPHRGQRSSLENGIKIVNLEQAIIDCIADIEKLTDWPRFLLAFPKMPQLSSDKLLEVLFQYRQKELYQKVACLLEALNDYLSLRKTFFARCHEEVSEKIIALFPIKRGLTLNKKWNVLAPIDMEAYVRQSQDIS